jgi:hypothetical protein
MEPRRRDERQEVAGGLALILAADEQPGLAPGGDPPRSSRSASLVVSRSRPSSKKRVMAARWRTA